MPPGGPLGPDVLPLRRPEQQLQRGVSHRVQEHHRRCGLRGCAAAHSGRYDADADRQLYNPDDLCGLYGAGELRLVLVALLRRDVHRAVRRVVRFGRVGVDREPVLGGDGPLRNAHDLRDLHGGVELRVVRGAMFHRDLVGADERFVRV